MWVECGDCQRGYEIDVSGGARRVKCLGCGNVFVAGGIAVPAPAREVTDPQGSWEASPVDLAPPAHPAEPVHGGPLKRDSLLRVRRWPAGAAPRLAAQNGIGASAVGIDRVTPMVLLGLVLVQALNVMRGLWVMAEVPAQVRDRMHLGPAVVIATALVDIGLFFGLVATAVWLGLYIASRVFKFVLAEPVYIKAAGVAALPAVIIALVRWLPPNPPLVMLLMLGIFPLAWLMLRLAFAMNAMEAFGSLGASCLLYVLAQTIAFGISGQVAANYCPRVHQMPAGDLLGWTDPVERWRLASDTSADSPSTRPSTDAPTRSRRLARCAGGSDQDNPSSTAPGTGCPRRRTARHIRRLRATSGGAGSAAAGGQPRGAT